MSSTQKSLKRTNAGNKAYADRQKNLSKRYKEEKLNNPKITYDEVRKEFYRTSTKEPQAGPSRTSSSSAKPPESVIDRNQIVPDGFWNIDMGDDDEPMLEVPNLVENHSTESGGSRSIAGGNLLRLYRSPLTPSFQTTFEKAFILYGYGFNFEKFAMDAEVDVRTTPFAFIPVDYIPSYLSIAEFNTIPNNSYVSRVHCSIKVLGVRTAFDTGSTLSGVANSEHVSLGASIIGMNKLLPIRNVQYTAVNTAPMKPTAVTTFDEDAYVKKLYSDVASSIMGAPRSITGYAAILENFDKVPAGKPDYPVHINGPPMLKKYMDRYHVNSHVGNTIVNYNYSPVYSPIRGTPVVDFNIGSDTDNISNNTVVQLDRTLVQEKDGKATVTAKSTPYEGTDGKYQTAKTYTYKQPIEKPYVFRPHNNKTQQAQPQVHVALFPTPKINPSLEYTDIQNSSIYYEVVFKMEIRNNVNSFYPNSNLLHVPITKQYFIVRRQLNIMEELLLLWVIMMKVCNEKICKY
ncbi:unnamed protein product [Brassicogethes aeneus]|uniref:Capsid protein n=1 Tax=Brassicogethes aeneus TaxID=1431903 RepID=A0A9P0BG83_BRAAE|nr:unnamed protein product [Brassicogethes aeneus]